MTSSGVSKTSWGSNFLSLVITIELKKKKKLALIFVPRKRKRKRKRKKRRHLCCTNVIIMMSSITKH